ncbi:MAG: helix-turn-helix transcriptional regulator [Delftia lacustris]|jgi:transcriptional regulator with XRE-family HTH domain|uniref:helix-turn-helix domain-containing protein n=1 Tax=Delftia TaxID=80865 RepID=UPI00259C883F|nr:MULTISPECIES: helix-turn-helix transcriptional regulator [unclassified Delftia]WON86766.1 helix-turn-helix domain-containing protein [Delftia sp. UGAL515B_04]
MNIGQAMQLARKKRRLSQAALAERADISVSYLSLLERGRRDPPLSTIKRIAAALVMPVEILFFLGAEDGELGQLNRDLAGQLAITALELLNEPLPEQTELPS